MYFLLFERVINKELLLSRVINPQPPGRERNQLVKSIGLSIRELAFQDELNPEVKDITAFVALSLNAISSTVDQTASAWEKRGYWVKADRFRMEWSWVDIYYKKIIVAINNDDWEELSSINIQIAQIISYIKLPKRNQRVKPWKGAWITLHEKIS